MPRSCSLFLPSAYVDRKIASRDQSLAGNFITLNLCQIGNAQNRHRTLLNSGSWTSSWGLEAPVSFGLVCFLESTDTLPNLLKQLSIIRFPEYGSWSYHLTLDWQIRGLWHATFTSTAYPEALCKPQNLPLWLNLAIICNHSKSFPSLPIALGVALSSCLYRHVWNRWHPIREYR